ncbi:MAG: sel1 repeat family protein [Gammaproteobacteria bacterium]|nr:sel1 repeat family protein [Gammaproteobacteria bacterium]
MRSRITNAWIVMLSLMLVPALANAQDDPGLAGPGLEAFRAGEYLKARDLWQTEALMGDPRSQFYLGYLYEAGQGVTVDYEMAVSWYLEASRNECRIADCNLGNLYSKGLGVEVDHHEAISRMASCYYAGTVCPEQIVVRREMAEKSLTLYAERGYGDAAYAMANVRLDYGDFSGSTAWLEKAAQQQHGPSEAALANAYLMGSGVDQDVERGAALLFEAMIRHRDNAEVLRSAKGTLAMAYGNRSIWARKPLTTAYVWARLSQAEHPEANSFAGAMYGSMVDELEPVMTDAELDTANTLVSRWGDLFAAGLPGVTQDHLRTLTLPQ